MTQEYLPTIIRNGEICCWWIAYLDGGPLEFDIGGVTHYDTRDEAVSALIRLTLSDYDSRHPNSHPRRARPERMQLVREDSPCAVVQCRACGVLMHDEDLDQVAHFDDVDMAESMVTAWLWLLDHAGEAHCPDHPPTGDERPSLHAPVDGQLALVPELEETG